MVTVVLADDEALMRAGLRLMIDGVEDIRVVGEAGDGSQAIALATQLNPDVLLMDVRMPGMGGIEAVQQWRQQGGRAAVVMLTAFDTDEFLMGALRAGADSFLLKDAPPQEVVRAVLDAHHGGSQFSPSVIKRLMALASNRPDAPSATVAAAPLTQPPRPLAERDRGDSARPDWVTQREWAVAQLVADGCTNAEIAERLSLSLPTVKTHLGKLFDKFDVTNRVRLAIAVIDRTR